VSLVGFKAQNHAQQTAARGARDDVDDRGTERAFIRDLEKRFRAFTLDVAAAQHNTKAPRFYTREDDGLSQSWNRPDPSNDFWTRYREHNEMVWCNPPYSDIRPWVEKAWVEWHGRLPHPGNLNTFPSYPPPTIVMLLPANRTEQGWWQDLVEPYRDRLWSPLRVEFLRGRMRFDRPGAVIGPKGDRPPFGCCLLIWEGGAS